MVGGGSRSSFWNSFLSSLLNRKLSVCEQSEFGAALGVARLAMYADESRISKKDIIKEIKVDKNKILKEFDNNDVLLIPGFQGINSNNEITTLGRGGSDTSAVAVAASLDAECIIYTDVEGVFTTDPNLVKNAKKISQISSISLS